MASSVAEKFKSMEYGPAREDSREVRGWLDGHGRRFGHFIAGGWTPPCAFEKGVGSASFTTIDPSTGDILASVD